MNKSPPVVKLEAVGTLDDNARGNLIDEMKDLCAELPIYLVAKVDREPRSLTTGKAAAKRKWNTRTFFSTLSSFSVKEIISDAKIT